MVGQRLNKGAALQYRALNFIEKNSAHARPSCRSAESPNILRYTSMLETFSLKLGVQNKELHHRDFPNEFCTVTLFEIIGRFSERYLSKTFSEKVEDI